MSLFNFGGQFGGLFNNWMMNQYNQRMRDYNQQQSQYQQDMDYWDQLNQYDQDKQSFDMWNRGLSRSAPIQPRQKPNVIGPPPVKPDMFGAGGAFGGAGGGGGFKPTAPPGFQGFNYSGYSGPSYQAVAGFDNQGIDTAGMVDPTAVIQSAQPAIMEAMNDAFADAGNRFGSSGMVGTPYADALGDAARSASSDIAHITNQYTYQSALDAAQREQERAMAEYMADYNAWAQAGDWAHQGQLADMQQGLSAWGQMGDWQSSANQLQNQLANQQWMAQNDWGFQDYSQQQNMLMQMIPYMMSMMGGGY